MATNETTLCADTDRPLVLDLFCGEGGMGTGLARAGDRELRRRAMEIDWMSGDGLNEAIPPRYGEFIGAQLFTFLHRQAVAA